jgi:S1-C subfamily serine protease
LIIGVDGKRVANIIDFDDEMKSVKPGDRIYLSVLRRGSRVQVPIDLPPESKTN